MLENFIKIKSGLQIDPLLDAVMKNSYLWGENTKRQDWPGSPHKYTQAIYLRWPESQSVEAAFFETEAIDYPAFDILPEARPLVAEIVKAVGGKKLGRVMIVKLESGQSIEKHADEGLVADTYERFHLPLYSLAGNWFFSLNNNGTGEVVHMNPAELWFFDHKKTHWVENDSFAPRIHLILDIVAPEFRRERHALSA